MLFRYLACLSSSSSNDKLAFDVGLQEQSEGELLPLLCVDRSLLLAGTNAQEWNKWNQINMETCAKVEDTLILVHSDISVVYI